MESSTMCWSVCRISRDRYQASKRKFAMRAGCPMLLALVLLPVAGCEQLEPFRQGILTTYRQELRQLGDRVSNEELAKTPDEPEAGSLKSEVTPVAHWHAPPLLNDVHL